MAICLSHLFTAMAGSVAGLTFFRNRYCSIVVRNRTIPVDPATPAQVTVRSRFSAAMSAWQALSQSDRNTWNYFSQGTPWNNHLGIECRLTGLGIYMSIRLSALQIDPTIPSATFDSCPCTPGLFTRENVSIGPCTSGIMNAGFSLSLTNNHPTSSIILGVHISTAQSQSINFWKGPYDSRNYFTIGPLPPGFPVSVDKVGLVAGARYFLKFRTLDSTNNNIVSSDWYYHADANYCIS